MEDYPCQTKINGFWKMLQKEKMINNQWFWDIYVQSFIKFFIPCKHTICMYQSYGKWELVIKCWTVVKGKKMLS
jgi:hypothetical protein